MDMNTRKSKQEFQRQFLERAGINFPAVKALMDFLPNVGFYIKDANDRIVTLNQRNCEISALKDEFDAIGLKSSDLFPEPISQQCLARDATVRKNGKAVVGGINFATVDRSPTPTIYSVFPLRDAKGRLIGTMCGFYKASTTEMGHLARIRLQPALDWMVAHDGEKSSLKELAELTGLSVTHFRRLFAATFNETPAKYALRLRLNRAVFRAHRPASYLRRRNRRSAVGARLPDRAVGRRRIGDRPQLALHAHGMYAGSG